jgi:hypothetical protein
LVATITGEVGKTKPSTESLDELATQQENINFVTEN